MDRTQGRCLQARQAVIGEQAERWWRWRRYCWPQRAALSPGGFVFPLAYWILGSGYQVRTDEIVALIGIMALTALLGAAIGLLLGTIFPITHLSLIFSIVITPLIFTGCLYYPWGSLGVIRWFQVLTLFNPLTYASEGMRYAMVPFQKGGGRIARDGLGTAGAMRVPGALTRQRRQVLLGSGAELTGRLLSVGRAALLSSDHLRTGAAARPTWMFSWQGRHVTSVLRRLLAMR
jgi:ABC-2 type transporter